MRSRTATGNRLSRRLIAGVALASFAGAAQADDIKTTVTRVTNTDGSAAVSVTSVPVWLEGARFGLDLSVAAATVSTVQPGRPLPWAVANTSAAAAWARMDVPVQAAFLPWTQSTVDMRLDPTQESGRLGTTFSRSWVVWDHITASFNDSYALTRSLDQAAGWETGKSVSLNLRDTGTVFSVATNLTSSDHAWLPSASAQQQLMGPLTLTTTVANTGSEISKSITAGFRHTW